MSEISKLMSQIAAFPDTEAVGLALSYGSSYPEFGYNICRPGDPAHRVKMHLFSVLSFCALSFGSGIDLSLVKSEIFG